MRKVFTILSKTLLALAVIAFGASLVIPGITSDVTDLAYFVQMSSNVIAVICAIVGAILIYSGKETTQRIGHGFTIASFVIGLANAIMYIGIESKSSTGSNAAKTISSTAAIVMIIAVALLAAYYVLQFILLILKKNAPETDSPNEDSRVARIKEWKQILDDGIITQEEYEEKRIQILGLKQPKQK